jgi:hypothetical protein
MADPLQGIALKIPEFLVPQMKHAADKEPVIPIQFVF